MDHLWKSLHQKEFQIKDMKFVLEKVLKQSKEPPTRICKCFGPLNEEYIVKAICEKNHHDDLLFDYQLGELEYAKTVANLYDSSILTYEIAEKIDNVDIIVSKYRGINLSQYRKEDSPLLLCELLQIVIRVSNALNLLHGNGIIHSDIKPDNIFILETKTDSNIPALAATLGDLGIAKSITINNNNNNINLEQVSKIETLITQIEEESQNYYYKIEDTDSYFRGTKGYIAPECLEYHERSSKSDVWSLGRTLLTIMFQPKNCKTDQIRVSDSNALYNIPSYSCKDIQQYLNGISEMILHMDLNNDSNIIDVIKMGNLEMDINGWRLLLSLICKMLNDQPEDRPSCFQILRTIFLLDREIVSIAVQQYPPIFQFADEPLKKDREIALLAVGLYGLCLAYVDESLRKDRDIVKQAVKQDGRALEFAFEALKKDREIAKIAINQTFHAISIIDETLSKDREIIVLSIEKSPWALEFLDSTLRKDREIVMLAVKKDGLILEIVDESLKGEKEILSLEIKNKMFGLITLLMNH